MSKSPLLACPKRTATVAGLTTPHFVTGEGRIFSSLGEVLPHLPVVYGGAGVLKGAGDNPELAMAKK